MVSRIGCCWPARTRCSASPSWSSIEQTGMTIASAAVATAASQEQQQRQQPQQPQQRAPVQVLPPKFAEAPESNRANSHSGKKQKQKKNRNSDLFFTQRVFLFSRSIYIPDFNAVFSLLLLLGPANATTHLRKLGMDALPTLRTNEQTPSSVEQRRSAARIESHHGQHWRSTASAAACRNVG